jgi:hypothetical protein
MKTKFHKLLLFVAGLFLASNSAQATNFAGNGNTGFGGPVGQGTLSVTDDGTNITFTLQRGGGNLNDVLAIYIDTGTAGGYADTSAFTSTGGDDVNAISGYNGSSRSVMTFTNGFRPTYAIAIKPNYMDLFSLTNPASFSYITGTGQSGSSSASFSLTIQASQIGLTPGVSSSFKIFGTLTSSTAYRSTEAIAGNDYSAFGQGNNPFTQTAFATYNFAAPPAPSYPVTFQVDLTAQVTSGAFNPGNGDTVYAAGSFQTNAWSGFQLTNNPAAANTNIYSGTYLDYDPTNTAEQFKFNFHSVANANNTWEGVDNRPFILTAPGVTNSLVYFDDVFASPSATTNYLTFTIDMGPQIYLGHFNPGNGDTIQVLGTLENPKWTIGGFILTNNATLSGNASNIYSGTIPDGNYPGSYENYKFVIHTLSSGDTYESGNNRVFFTPTGSQTFLLSYFNGVSNIYSTPITFQVDMTAPILAGTFVPGVDTLSAAGTFQTNVWTAGAFLLTNNPAAANTNIYFGTYVDVNAPGAGEQFKFQINPGGNALSANWESVANHTFLLGSTAQTLPVLNWNNQDPANVLLVPTVATFTVNMTNALDIFGYAFDPNNDVVIIDGDFVNPQWPNIWTDPLIGGIDNQQFILTNNPVGSELYSGTFTIPAGNSLVVNYKYGIIHNYTGYANTNADNEAGFAQNHSRYIRTTGTYIFPVDLFGIQLTNSAAATEPSFGSLAIGKPSGGNLPLTWLGRPGVHLQYTTNLVGGTWVNLNATDGTNAANLPPAGSSTFYRLVNP